MDETEVKNALIADMTARREALMRLRDDAIARGMQELAIAYGWNAMALGQAILELV